MICIQEKTMNDRQIAEMRKLSKSALMEKVLLSFRHRGMADNEIKKTLLYLTYRSITDTRREYLTNKEVNVAMIKSNSLIAKMEAQ